jgi:hypothetical protein
LGNDYAPLFAEWPETQNTWETFRDQCNSWEWRMTDSDKLQKTVDEYFAKAYKFKMQGKDEESKAMTTKALRLQGSLTKAKPIEAEPKKASTLPPRTDTYSRTVMRRENNVHPDEDPALITVNNQTKMHSFGV